MSAQTRQHQTQSDQSTSSSTSSALAKGGPGNAVNAEKASSEEGTAAGLANYQATLGQWLGTELYQAIAGELTLDRLASHADAGLMAAFESALGSMEVTGDNTTEAVEKLTASLKQEFGTLAGDWLKENGAGVHKSLTDWVDANPIWVVTAALLAAAGAIMANAPIPELKKKFKLGDNLSGALAANLGRLRDVSLKSISAELSWTTGPLVAAVKSTHSNGQTETTVNASAGTEEHNLTAEGRFNGGDLELLSLQGVLSAGGSTYTAGAEQKAGDGGTQTTINANITTESGDNTYVNGLQYDSNTGIVTVERALTLIEDGFTTSITETSSSDGSSLNSLSVSGAVSESTKINLTLEESAQLLGANNSYGLTQTQRANLGVDYSTKDLEAAMQLGLDSQNNGSMSGKLDLSLGNGWTAGGDGKVEWGNTDYLEAGAYFGFRNPDEFQTYMTRYRFKSGDETTHELDLMIEEQFGPIYTRLQQQIAHSSSGMNFQTTAQGAYFFNDNFALIAGAQYNQNDRGDGSLSPQLGAQVFGVPLVITHDLENDTTTLGITLKFGRK